MVGRCAAGQRHQREAQAVEVVVGQDVGAVVDEIGEGNGSHGAAALLARCSGSLTTRESALPAGRYFTVTSIIAAASSQTTSISSTVSRWPSQRDSALRDARLDDAAQARRTPARTPACARRRRTRAGTAARPGLVSSSCSSSSRTCSASLAGAARAAVAADAKREREMASVAQAMSPSAIRPHARAAAPARRSPCPAAPARRSGTGRRWSAAAPARCAPWSASAPVTQRIETQGEYATGVNGQPTIGCTSVCSSAGAPSISASVLLVRSCAMPPCGHITVLVVVRMGITAAPQGGTPSVMAPLTRLTPARPILIMAVVERDVVGADLQLAGAAGERDLAAAVILIAGPLPRGSGVTSSASSSSIDLVAGSPRRSRAAGALRVGALAARPPGARPDRVVEPAGLELDPHARADLGQHHQAVAVAGERQGRHRPAARVLAQHGRHGGTNAAAIRPGRRRR